MNTSVISSCHTVECRVTSLIGKRNPLGPYRRPMPTVLGGKSDMNTGVISSCHHNPHVKTKSTVCRLKYIQNPYRGTSLERIRASLGPYIRIIPRVL